MSNISSGKSPLRDQKKGVGFVLLNSSKLNYQVYKESKKKETSIFSSYFLFFFVGILFFSIIQSTNYQKKIHINNVKQEINKKYSSKRIFMKENNIKKINSKILSEPTAINFLKNKDLENKFKNNELILSKIYEQDKIINQKLEEQNKTLRFLENQEQARKTQRLGQAILNLNRLGFFNFLN
tara:strand:+ start:48 stop:593 length:546 start_codon:yes stop_codon:yes gene_type:complete